MTDRRAAYAVADLASKTLLGHYGWSNQADRACKEFRANGYPDASWHNLTHPKTALWLKDAAAEASGMSSAEAEVYIQERVVRISSRYVLSKKASALLMEWYPWVPRLEDYLEASAVSGFRGATIEHHPSDMVEIVVDLDVADGGSTSDPARAGAYRAIMRLIDDIARFAWHASDDLKHDPDVAPVYTSSAFVIVSNNATGSLDLAWRDGDQPCVSEVDSDAIRAALRRNRGAAIARDNKAIEKWAADVIEFDRTTPAPF